MGMGNLALLSPEQAKHYLKQEFYHVASGCNSVVEACEKMEKLLPYDSVVCVQVGDDAYAQGVEDDGRSPIGILVPAREHTQYHDCPKCGGSGGNSTGHLLDVGKCNFCDGIGSRHPKQTIHFNIPRPTKEMIGTNPHFRELLGNDPDDPMTDEWSGLRPTKWPPPPPPPPPPTIFDEEFDFS